eukprot:2868136-Pyramimonas_sp.AAC.1
MPAQKGAVRKRPHSSGTVALLPDRAEFSAGPRDPRARRDVGRWGQGAHRPEDGPRAIEAERGRSGGDGGAARGAVDRR